MGVIPPPHATCLINKIERERERNDSEIAVSHVFIHSSHFSNSCFYGGIYILQTGSEVNRLLWETIQTSGKEEYYILYFYHNARSFHFFFFRVFHSSWEPTEILTTTCICSVWTTNLRAHFITRSSNLTWLSLLH